MTEKITASFVITPDLLEVIRSKAAALQAQTGIEVSDSAALRIILDEYGKAQALPVPAPTTPAATGS